MKYKALVSFAGAVTMAKGEIKEIDNPLIVKDLLSAKYIEPVKDNKKKSPVKGV